MVGTGCVLMSLGADVGELERECFSLEAGSTNVNIHNVKSMPHEIPNLAPDFVGLRSASISICRNLRKFNQNNPEVFLDPF